MNAFETFSDLDLDLNINDDSNLSNESNVQSTLEGIDLK